MTHTDHVEMRCEATATPGLIRTICYTTENHRAVEGIA